MKKIAWAAVLTVVVAVGIMAPDQAWARRRHFSHAHSHVFIGVGPRFWWGPPAPYWWYYPPAPYYVYSQPVIVQEQPPVYVQQPQAVPPVPPPPPAQQPYWYYCPSAQAYYPNVPSCPEAWIKVAPRSP